MTSSVDVDDIKDHLKITGTSQDDILGSYLLAAKAHVATFLRRDLDTEFLSGWPHDIDQAVRMLVAHWHQQKSAVAVGKTAPPVPFGVRTLLEPHRNLG